MLGNFDFNSFANADTDDYFRAQMTLKQFNALAVTLDQNKIIDEIKKLDYFRNKIKPALHLSINDVEKYLKNAWSTEYILSLNKLIIEQTHQAFSIHWAFPQAYYSVFTSTLSCFKSLGYTEESHNAVMKKFSSLVCEGKYPKSISFNCEGTKKGLNYNNINYNPTEESSISFNENNPNSINKHICQFLKSTREIQLNDKVNDLKFKNKKNEPLKRLSEAHWLKVSERVHNTTILDILYRKRIKANYKDIDTFTSVHLDGNLLIDYLIKIVGCLNLINEIYIRKAIGIDEFNKIKVSHLRTVNNEILKDRYNLIDCSFK